MLASPTFRRIVLSICLCFVAPVARGQITNVTNTTSTPMPGSGHDYIQMLDETVNPGNGSVSLRIKVPVPPGRKLTLPFSFAYDSNGVHHFVSDGIGGVVWLSNKSFISKGGWTYSMPMLSLGEGQTVYSPDGGAHVYSCDFFTDYVFQDPSGSRHALGLSYVRDSYLQCQFVLGAPYQVLLGGDGFFNAAITPPPPTNPFPAAKIADRDGTVYYFPYFGEVAVPGPVWSDLPTYAEDRNGNKIAITNNHNGAFSVSDTAGRTVISSSGFGATGNTIAVSGLSQPYTLTWGAASTNFPRPSFMTVLANGPCGGPSGDTETQPVVSKITLPNGKQYQFFYDGTYGLLNKVIYPTGGYVSYEWGPNPLSEGADFTTHDSYGNSYICQFLYGTYALSHRYVSFDGATLALQQDFSYTTNFPSSSVNWTSKQTTVTTRDLEIASRVVET